MLTLHSLFSIYGLDPKEVRLVRHSNKEISVLEDYRTKFEKFTEYCAWQRENKYGDAKHLAVFAPEHGTTSLFLGIWDVDGFTPNAKLTKKTYLASLKKGVGGRSPLHVQALLEVAHDRAGA